MTMQYVQVAVFVMSVIHRTATIYCHYLESVHKCICMLKLCVVKNIANNVHTCASCRDGQ